ncbi:DUF1592 domain-containing protein [Sorangium sp. So ce429]
MSITLSRYYLGAILLAAGGLAACGDATPGGEGGVPGEPAPPVDGPVSLPAEQLAERMARFVWDGEADAALVGAIRARSPLTQSDVAETAEDMLDDPRARQGVAAFYRWWLGLDHLPPAGKEDPDGLLDGVLVAAMKEEAPTLGVHLTLEEDATFEALLTAPFTFVNERLARHYGMSGVSGAELRKVPFAEDNRSGLLSGAGILTRFSSLSNPSWPAKRGWLVTDQILCSPVIRSFLPGVAPDPSRSIREQMISVTAGGSCMGCHDTLNSPGFAFIGFDSYGRWRPGPGQGPGETEGWIPENIMPDAPTFDGAADLARLLASRAETHRCFTRQWLQYALDRDVVVESDAPEEQQPSIDAALTAFQEADLSLRKLIVAVTRTDAFLQP